MIREQQEFVDKLKRKTLADRLLENPDFQEFIADNEKKYYQRLADLINSPTTDPTIAGIQADLKRLGEFGLRAKKWKREYSDVKQHIDNKQQQEEQTEDYSHG